jgi:hypothetical protein
VVIVADISGSMGDYSEPGDTSSPTKAQLATQGVRDLIADQAGNPGRTTFTLVQFTTGRIETVASFAAGDDQRLAGWACRPSGGTPLLDAAGMVINETGTQLAALPEGKRPGRVYFVIATDGKENQSREFTRAGIKAMITAQREQWKWEFLFLGAGPEAFDEAGGIGVPQAGAMMVNTARIGQAYAAASAGISRSRAGGQSVTYTEDERRQAGGS